MLRTSLAAVLGLAATDTLLAQALTHRSKSPKTGGNNNERLEFLGDRVLNLAVADLVYQTYPTADEGTLSLHHTALVRAEACAQVAAAWGVWPLLQIAPQKNKMSASAQTRLLADAVEALLGAVYLRQGMEAVQALVATHWAHLNVTLAEAKDAKTALQELLQAQGHPLPTYTSLGQTGPDHATTFTVEVACFLGSFQATGPSKAAASMVAAQQLLEKLNA